MAISPYAEDSEVSNPVKRIRWATRRVTGKEARRKRQSIFNRLGSIRGDDRSKRESAASAQDSGATGGAEDGNEAERQRNIYFNIPLPDSARDEQGHPLMYYERNKIRTAKYTPLSFIPKNLWFQFHNVANVYFFFIIILQIFSIFGSTNPGLSAVPLIVILTLTAIKDAIEDWRRTLLDNELNNAPVHRLIDWNNVNTAEDNVTPWRRFKKTTTKAVIWVWRLQHSRKSKKQDKVETYTERGLDERPSAETRRTSVHYSRPSFQSAREVAEVDDGAMEMTPVPSPTPGQVRSSDDVYQAGDEGIVELSNNAQTSSEMHQALEVPKRVSKEKGSSMPASKKFYGNLINPTKQAAETARFKKDYWKNVQVGDFVRLYNEEQIPADIIVLSTSDSDGACYVETKNLDGETNLKVRQALHSGQRIKRAKDCEKAEFMVQSEPPHANLYAYSGVVRWQQHDVKQPHAPPIDMAEPVTINNLLLRGCSLKNTEWVLGIVAFTGHETKIMLNSGITPSKRARISKDLNWNVIYNFIILFFMCLVSALVEGTNWAKPNTSQQVFEFGSYGNTPALNGFITFWAAIVLFQDLVPISLYITLEIVRTAQAFFIYSDTFMYYDRLDYPCTPKSWNISDDLGQVEYIFSDKTGTLTQNVMEFKKCSVNGVPYGEAYTEALAGMQKRQGIDVEKEGSRAREQIAEDRVKMLADIRKAHDNPYLRDDELTFVAPDFMADLAGQSGPAQKAANEQFMLALALCHTVITERTPGDPPRIDFKAQSPDEAALVATARDLGFTVMGRSNEGIILSVMGDEREYTVLNTLEFNSTRKRMSAIMRMPDGKIILFCKGADSIIYSRLRKGEQPELRKTTAEHLEMFAREGLRTLCIAQKELSEEEYQRWSVHHDLAAAAVQDREDKVEVVADMIEKDLTLLGGTAIEDRLQDGVPDAIQLLAQAGIKLWVLTGDKVETAINIGFSCNLLDNDMDLILLRIDEDDMAMAEAELDRHLATFGKTGSDEEMRAAKTNHEPPAPTHALVIDGDSLKLVLDEKLRQKFLLLCKECRSVLCCRVSPAQKAAVVSMVKSGLDCLTLSIGDGANDVAMIQEAHVGVGIAGEEGRQAVMSSDFAIGQFRFLCRLMLVHGRWNYRRLAESIANFFYKNMVWTFAIFWYQIYANYDCSYVFDYTYILLYTLAFTSLPVIFMAILDQDVDDKVSLAVPQLYRRGIERKEWTQVKFWVYMVDGIYQSVICFFVVYLLFAPANFVSESGQDVNDYKRMGVYIANGAVVVVNVYVLLNTYRWDWFMCLITAISILLVWFWTGVYTAFTGGFTFYKSAPQVYGQLSFWALTLLMIVLCLLPRFLAKSYQKLYMPRDVDIIREQIRQGKFDYLRDVDPNAVAPPLPEKAAADSASSSDISKPSHNAHKFAQNQTAVPEDERPMFPPSVAPTTTTHNPRSQNGSDGTDYTGHRSSLDHVFHTDAPTINRHSLDAPRPSFDRPRPSFDRVRTSMDRTRPSIEASHDFTSAAYLTKVESRNSAHRQDQSSRLEDLSAELR